MPRKGFAEQQCGRGPAQPAVQRHQDSEGHGAVGGEGPAADRAGQSERRHDGEVLGADSKALRGQEQEVECGERMGGEGGGEEDR